MKVCYTGGGTAGHIIPALAVAEELRLELDAVGASYEAFWIGTKDQAEKDMVENAGIRFRSIPTGKLRRYLSWKNIADVFRIFAGICRSVAILKNERPDVLFSKGGFASVPPVIAAWLLRIPSVTHESDVSTGLANRINARFVTTVCLSCEDAAKNVSRKQRWKTVVTGNPVRKELLRADPAHGRTFLHIDSDMPLILVLGGSQGALQINELVWDCLEALCGMAFVVHQTGSRTWKRVEHDRYLCMPFLHDELYDIIAASSLVISRAGAGTLAELAALRRPMLLLPLGTDASRGDQILNARRMEAVGAAKVLLRGDATKQRLLSDVWTIMSDASLRERMSEACAKVSVPDAAKKIACEISSACKLPRNEVRGN
ncbi:MAG: undecaprenyldiphospho-muramoylpentapeptide beta-N-acetylglucosaminyltransferase [Sphaerochaetaceae bacterium]